MIAADPTRTQLLSERQTGIGGSDVSALFNIGYGCALRLWREKRGEQPDYDDRDSGPMKLGRWLEPHIADEYERLTGRRVSREPVLRHREHGCLLVHIDRGIRDRSRPDPGVLEIKALGARLFAECKRNGLAVDYLLQIEHGMLVSGRSWGAFAVMSRDSGELLHWDVERDEKICQQILEAGPEFWSTLTDGPPPPMLSPDDPRCQRCQFRLSCQGAALMRDAGGDDTVAQDDSLAALLEEYDRCKAMADEAEDLIESAKENIRVALAGRKAVRVGKRPIYHRVQTSMRWDSETMAQAYCRTAGTVDYDGTFLPVGIAKAAKDFKRPSVTQPLRIY